MVFGQDYAARFQWNLFFVREFDFTSAADPDNVLAPGSRMPFLHVTGRQFQIEKSAGFHKRGLPDTIGAGYEPRLCSLGVSLAIGACIEPRDDNGLAPLRRDKGDKDQ